jgi:hypothetical protein
MEFSIWNEMRRDRGKQEKKTKKYSAMETNSRSSMDSPGAWAMDGDGAGAGLGDRSTGSWEVKEREMAR